MTDISIIGIGTTILSIFLIFIVIKQILGLPGYTIYYPLLTGIAWIVVRHFVDMKIIVLMLVAAIAGWFIQKRLTKKYISLLHYPRQGLYVAISTLILIPLWRILSRRNILDRQVSSALLWYIFLTNALILFIAPKVFGQGKGIVSLTRWTHAVWFGVLTALCMYIVTYEGLMQRFERYPFLFIIVFLLCIILGKYQWLQMMEMMRFRGIITSKKITHTKYTNK